MRDITLGHLIQGLSGITVSLAKSGHVGSWARGDLMGREVLLSNGGDGRDVAEVGNLLVHTGRGLWCSEDAGGQDGGDGEE
jgi:hypothetical protein